MKEIKYLIIDDDPDDRDFFEIALDISKIPYQLTWANDSMKALALLSEPSSVPDYIFLDLNMPLVSGKECLQEIRKLPHLKNIPVIIYTTSSYYMDIENTKELGATHYITKIPDIDRLSDTLVRLRTNNELPYQLT